MSEALPQTLKKLRLSGLASTLEVRLHEAAAGGLNHREFLELLLQDELLVRNSRLINRRLTAAGFRETRTLEDFDFSFNPSVKKTKIFDLATGRFIRERKRSLNSILASAGNLMAGTFFQPGEFSRCEVQVRNARRIGGG